MISKLKLCVTCPWSSKFFLLGISLFWPSMQLLVLLPNLQVRDLVTVVIPLREVVLVEKVDNAASGELGTDSLVVTTKGKVHDLLIIHDLLYHT